MNPPRFTRQIRACWLGKNIGGTLGGPHEGRPGPLALSYYDPVPQGVLPNDDLDLQIVWLHHLRRHGHRTLTPDVLADAWAQHVLWPPDEYGIVRRNSAYGLRGHSRGAFDNYFAESMGAAIRSELWACIAPGQPERAAAFAWADAAVDHCGDGIYAEIFHAALQSAAFVERDRERLLATALSFLPDDSRLRRALLETMQWWAASRHWETVRERVVARYATGNFTDVACNLCFELIGWYAGNGDFGRSLCIATNCGFDTDCTAATLGALLGILDPDSITPEWKAPIGDEIVISKKIVGIDSPLSLDELTEWTLALGSQLRDAPVKIGPVVARSVATSAIGPAIPAEISDDGGRSWQATTLFGHWQQWQAANYAGASRQLRIGFDVTVPEAVKLMAFYRPGITAAVDDRPVIRFSEADLSADPFIAPSFHRARAAAHTFHAGELSPGRHTLTLTCARPSDAGPCDLVFGFGDPETNFWLPHFLAHPASAPATT